MTPSRNIALIPSLLGAALAGAVAGCALSDYIAISGFPHRKYVVELAHEGTPQAAYECQRLSNAYGPELSFFNKLKNAQDGCVLEVTADLLQDGSMLWYPGSLTWYGREIQNHPAVRIPKSRIKSVRPRET
jgi:hypothetical protein